MQSVPQFSCQLHIGRCDLHPKSIFNRNISCSPAMAYGDRIDFRGAEAQKMDSYVLARNLSHGYVESM